MDNASVNDVIARAVGSFFMQKLSIHFTPQNGQINCVAHVLNLVVQSILAAFDEADDPDVIDYFNKELPIHYDSNDDEAQKALEDEEFSQNDDNELEDDSEEDEDEEKIQDNLSGLKKVHLIFIAIALLLKYEHISSKQLSTKLSSLLNAVHGFARLPNASIRQMLSWRLVPSLHL
jgi:hypothetical protein